MRFDMRFTNAIYKILQQCFSQSPHRLDLIYVLYNPLQSDSVLAVLLGISKISKKNFGHLTDNS